MISRVGIALFLIYLLVVRDKGVNSLLVSVGPRFLCVGGAKIHKSLRPKDLRRRGGCRRKSFWLRHLCKTSVRIDNERD